MTFAMSGSLPSRYLLRSAARVLSIVGRTQHTEFEVRSSYRATASGGILSTGGLLRAERWLLDNGWMIRDGVGLSATRRALMLPNHEAEVSRELVRTILLDSPPTWLGAVAVRGEIRPEFLPLQAARVLGEMFSPEERDSLLLAAAEKYDAAALLSMGEAAEESVVVVCRTLLEERGRADLVPRVRRVSLISDAVGYDIQTPNLAGMDCRLEVKCFRGRQPKFFISRNEFQVGRMLPRWYLVLCRAMPNSPPGIVGWTSLDPLVARMPSDVHISARWQSARVQFAESDLQPGLPISHLD